MAKLRLLERGLLEAAQGVDDIRLRVKQKKTKPPKGEEGEDASDDDKDPDIPDEAPHEFIARLNLYVAIHLSRSPTSTRDSYKDGLIYQTRKDLINEFLKACISKKCQNEDCGWYAGRFSHLKDINSYSQHCLYLS